MSYICAHNHWHLLYQDIIRGSQMWLSIQFQPSNNFHQAYKRYFKRNVFTSMVALLLPKKKKKNRLLVRNGNCGDIGICHIVNKAVCSAPCKLYALLSTYSINVDCCCSVIKSCPALCSLMYCSLPGSSTIHCLLEFAQIHVYQDTDAM